MVYSAQEQQLLSRHFSELEPRDHADIYLVRNLPPEVAATLNGVYSRSHLSMREQFLQRLKKGLEEAGRSLDDIEIPAEAPDVLAEILSDKSGKFLKTYAIDHGHNSLREGSVLHLAVENVSQLVTRFVQRERRCTFEESSTRYISFSRKNHWRDPEVIADDSCSAAYDEVLSSTFSLYEEFTGELLAFLEKTRPLAAGEKPAPYNRALRAEAFDAARYLLTPAIFTKWGMVIDSRTLADMITELRSHPLAEFRLVGERLQQQGNKTAKTLLRHAEPNSFTRDQHRALAALAETLEQDAPPPTATRPSVELLRWDPDLDRRMLASLAYEHSHSSWHDLERAVAAMTPQRQRQLLERTLAQRGGRDALPAALEGAQPFEFEVMLDFGAYRDIGRHRKGMQQQQLLTTEHGYLTPPLIEQAGLAQRYHDTLDRCSELQQQVARAHPIAAGYVTPFAFLQRVRLIFDPRQVAYFVELRSGPEGHFAYRDVAIDMHRAVEKVAPLFASLVRVQSGSAFLGRMSSEQGADDRRRRRMMQAGDLPS